MTAADELHGYVEVWWSAVGDLLALLESLHPAEWDLPTDLPGWDVRAVAAHTAHLERVLATGEEEHAEVGEPPHVRGLLGLYTEIGVVNRRDVPTADIVAEIREATAARHAALLADPPTDPDARPEQIFGGVPWSWRVLLRNRPLDVWMHEQDVRRATGRPGGLDSAAAAHTAAYLAESVGFVLAKRVGAAPGTSLVLDLDGTGVLAFEVDAEGRGRRLAALPADPTVRLGTDRETFVLAAGGRRSPASDAVRVEGDADLAARVLDALATTP